jgi:Na+/H+ antiporter NhaD/arsenite permease-like protein
VARIGGSTPGAWWVSILTVGPILGSFITEPAAMTISALLLRQNFYRFQPSERLRYATLGLLFVNVSVGGTLTHFAAPPVLMVAGTWGWGFSHMLLHFGWKAVLGILVANTLYYFYFRGEFARLARSVTPSPPGALPTEADVEVEHAERRHEVIPFWVSLTHVFALFWTVFTAHYTALYVGGFLVFLAFTQATRQHQDPISLRSPVLVGFFLAGLVIHGTLQQWWIEPVLSTLTALPLMFGSTILTAFNDNAAITYLASLVPNFSPELKYAVVAGAVTGGGLTVIANAPNPAGQSILGSSFGTGGISPLKLFLGALVPTIVMFVAFLFLPS